MTTTSTMIDTKPAASGSIRGWVICLLAATFYCYEYLLRIEPNIMEHALRLKFNLNAAGLGWLLASYFYAYTPLQLFVGVIIDRYGCRIVLTWALMLCIIGCALFSIAPTLPLAIVGRWLLGFGSAFAFIGILRLGMAWLPPKYFAFFVGLTTALGMLGAMFGEIFLSHLLTAVSWHVVLVLSAVFGLIMLPFFMTLVREPRVKQPWRTAHQNTMPWLTGLVVIKRMEIWRIGFIACVLFSSLSVVAGVWGIPWIKAAYQQNTVWATGVVTAIFTGWLVGAPLIGALNTKFFSQRALLLAGSVLATVSFGFLLWGPHLSRWALWLCLFCFGVGSSAEVLCFAMVSRMVPLRLSATAMAFTNFLVMMSGFLLQPLFAMILSMQWTGVIRNHLHYYTAASYHHTFIGLFILLCLATWLTYTMPPVLQEKK